MWVKEGRNIDKELQGRELGWCHPGLFHCPSTQGEQIYRY